MRNKYNEQQDRAWEVNDFLVKPAARKTFEDNLSFFSDWDKEWSKENVKKNNVEHLVQIEQKDIFKLDLSETDVLTLFLLSSMLEKLIPQFDKLKPGSRIVSYRYGMRGVVPDQTVNFTSPKDKTKHIIYLWKTPLNKVWLWKDGKPPARTDWR